MLGHVTVKGEGHIVDEFNPQFDRDCEPVRGSYGDDYYWQLVENVRRYKGMAPPQPVSPIRTVAVDAPAADWASVTPVYHDTIGDTADRDWDANVKDAAGKVIHYTDHTARNDLATAPGGPRRKHRRLPRHHRRQVDRSRRRQLDDPSDRRRRQFQNRLERL